MYNNIMLKLFVTLLSFPVLASASEIKSWQMGFQEAVSPVMSRINELHNYLLVLITLIVILVFCLLVYVCVRFNSKSNPVPSKTSHNTMIEIIWTVIPVLILVVISVPSLRTLYYVEKIEDTEVSVKIVGHQWYWEYIYPDNGITFDSNLIKDSELKPGQLRLLEVDNRLVLPVNTNIKFIITAADVLHSWAVPAFGIKTDAVPGRVNETWVRIDKPGVYYGQCSELCGQGHGFMPIAVEAVSKEEFDNWVNSKKKSAANNNIVAVNQ